MSNKLAFAAVIASSLPLISGPAFAEDEVIEEMIVTGSHISRAREEMSTPVDVMDREDFEAQGGIKSFIKKHLPQANFDEVDPDLVYDWSLNGI